MRRPFAAFVLCAAALARPGVHAQPASAPTPAAPEPGAAAWIARSNAWANMILDVQFEHAPEFGSHEGLAKFDKRIGQPTLAEERQERRELEAVLAKIKAQQPRETDENVAQDLEIMRKALELRFRREDYELAHEVPFINASEQVFGGLRVGSGERGGAQDEGGKRSTHGDPRDVGWAILSQDFSLRRERRAARGTLRGPCLPPPSTPSAS